VKIEIVKQGGHRQVIELEPGATKGATVGVNVWNQDGTLFVPAAATPQPGGPPITYWKLILEIPPNVVALANTATTGLYVITGAGTSATRTIEAVAGETTITNGSGVAGNPAVGLANVADAGGGELLRFVRDAKGRVSGTSSATTDNLTEGATNLYFTAQRVRDAVLTGLSTATNAAITAADSVLSAFGKLQAQITALSSSLSGYVPTSRTISTTAPLSGGGDLSANRTLSISAATTSAAGSMSAADKTKLDGIAAGATVGANWLTNLSNIPANIVSWSAIAPASKLDASAVSAFMLTVLDDTTAAAARTTLEAMPERLTVSGTNADYSYVAADSNVARGKTTGTPRTYTVDASVLTVGAYYYGGNYASTGDVTLAPAVGTTMRLAGTATTGNRTVGPFGLGRIWVRSATEVWVDGPGVT
jgi:hypothetical protein